MKIYLPNSSKQGLGGGFTFRRGLIKGLGKKVTVVNNWKDCDIVLITGVTMTDRTEMEQAKKAGKKIILRVDNLPKDSRNRGTAFSRMRDFAKLADYIVYQSGWSLRYVGWWLRNKVGAEAAVCEKCYSIIYNGVDTSVFNYDDKPSERDNNYLIVQYNRDENKRIPEALYHFHLVSRNYPDAVLKIVGQFSPEVINYNFDFFADENVEYLGIIDEPAVMAEIMRTCKYFYFPAYLDSCSNTLAEALACSCTPLLINDEGGSIEVMEQNVFGVKPIEEMADEYYEVFKKVLGD